MGLKLDTTNIVPPVISHWAKHFAKLESNLRDVRTIGWNPLNCNLLLDKDALVTKPPAIDLTQSSPKDDKNYCSNESSSTTSTSSDSKNLS